MQSDYSHLFRVVIGINMVLFGISQSLNPNSWIKYLPDQLQKYIPFSPHSTLRIHALGNLIIGSFLIFNVWSSIILWITLFWWISILPFAYYRHWTIGLRDNTIVAAIIYLIYQSK